jgi:alkylated DNA repair dioxygenase AlkB
MIVAREALGADAQAWLLRAIRADDLVDFPDDESNAAEEEAASEGGSQRRRNQAMRFGRKHLPTWALELADAIAHLAARPTDNCDDNTDTIFPPEVLARGDTKRRVFDQMIVNNYVPGDGLTPHIDLHAFADGVAVVSLQSAVVMDMYPPVVCGGGGGMEYETSYPVWLDPGDVLFLSGDARWRWRHGIAKRRHDPPRGWSPIANSSSGAAWVTRGFRTSVTLRAMREDGHELKVPA